MRKSIVLGSIAALGLAGSAFADEGFSYSYLEADYVNSNFDGVSDNAAIVRTIVNLGHSLNMDVIAEGIETTDQLAFLQELGCKFGQGFLFSRPLPAQETPALLSKKHLIPKR